MKHSVYLITCKNGKHYCGYTSRSPKTRLDEHLEASRKRKRRKSKLLNALRVHGLQMFQTLKEFDSELDALLFEIETIKKMNLMQDGLNMSPGGEGRSILVKLDVKGHTIERRTKREDKFRRPKRRKKTRYSRRRRR